MYEVEKEEELGLKKRFKSLWTTVKKFLYKSSRNEI